MTGKLFLLGQTLFGSAEEGPPMSVTIHIAGFACQVGTDVRQLCAWCGHRLIDVDLAMMMSPNKEDGSPPDPYRCWEPGALVAIAGNGYWVVVHEDGAPLPANACAKQVKLRLVDR